MFKTILHDKTGRCAKCSCLGGCLALVMVVIIIIAVFKYLAGPGYQRVSVIPDNFPSIVPVYKADQATKIEYLSDKDKNRITETFSALGKYIASLFLSPEKRPKISTIEGGIKIEHEIKFSDIWQTLKKPMTGEKMDHIIIEWQNLNDEFYQVKTFYISSFLEKDFALKKGSTGDNFYNLTFSQDKISGELNIEQPEKTDKVNVRLTVDFPMQN